MRDTTRSIRIPADMDDEIEEHKPKLNISTRYKFFLKLGLTLYTHKTIFERNPELIQRIVNEQTELLYKAKYGSQLEEFLKDLDYYKLDSIKMMIEFEQERRRKVEEAKRGGWY